MGRKPGIRSCPVCLKKFARPANVRRHIRSVHESFDCLNCAFVASQLVDLTAHKRIHTDPKPNQCPGCGEAFGDDYSLELHIVTEGCDPLGDVGTLHGHIQPTQQRGKRRSGDRSPAQREERVDREEEEWETSRDESRHSGSDRPAKRRTTQQRSPLPSPTSDWSPVSPPPELLYGAPSPHTLSPDDFPSQRDARVSPPQFPMLSQPLTASTLESLADAPYSSTLPLMLRPPQSSSRTSSPAPRQPLCGRTCCGDGRPSPHCSRGLVGRDCPCCGKLCLCVPGWAEEERKTQPPANVVTTARDGIH